jgi:hypothetical protein
MNAFFKTFIAVSRFSLLVAAVIVLLIPAVIYHELWRRAKGL